MKYLETTPTKLPNQSEKVFDHVCTHRPVRIVSKVRPDIIFVLATDYEDMRIELDRLKLQLLRIAEWNEITPAKRLDIGSWGERNHYKNIALNAIYPDSDK